MELLFPNKDENGNTEPMLQSLNNIYPTRYHNPSI